MERRQFLKLAAVSSVAAGASSTAQARPNHPPLPDAVGMLYDSTLCVGCQACVFRCQEINADELNENPQNKEFSVNDKLSVYSHNVIQIWESGNGKNKDKTDNGYAYIKRQCMHCVDPGCVSACPVSAMTKNAKTGIVEYNVSVCTGCRYCMVACPYNVPQYEYNDVFGRIQKCQLCNQKGVEILDKGGIPGCAEVCPTGAVLYGTREALLAEAKKRLSAQPNDTYLYPRLTLDSNDHHQGRVPVYEQHIYGEHEGGGTQVLVLSGVPSEKLGLPQLEERSLAARSETTQHTLYKGMILPLALLGGFLWRTQSVMKKQEHEHEQHDSNEKGGE